MAGAEWEGEGAGRKVGMHPAFAEFAEVKLHCFCHQASQCSWAKEARGSCRRDQARETSEGWTGVVYFLYYIMLYFLFHHAYKSSTASKSAGTKRGSCFKGYPTKAEKGTRRQHNLPLISTEYVALDPMSVVIATNQAR